ncbi:pyridoxamine 5'-phosphate oxidase family protein [Maricaulaceae bacterium MS644]
MTDIAAFKTHPQDAIFKAAEDAVAVMLGNPKQGRTFQPMSPKVDRQAQVLRFFAASDSDLCKGLGGASSVADVTCIVTAKDFDLFASIEGELADVTSGALIEKHWDTVAAAWFEKGKDDPKLRLLEFRPAQAAVWASSDDQSCFSWEIDRAAGQTDTPDVGVRLTTDFTDHKAA